jgi:hypothetical protein
MTDTTITHDQECENLPGGTYHGKTIGSLPIPCHCVARADGRALAERELKASRA